MKQPESTSFLFWSCLFLPGGQACIFAQPILDPCWPENPKIVSDAAYGCIQQTIDGGYITAGQIVSSEGVFVHVSKLDAQGNLDPTWPQRPRNFGGRGQEGATCVQQTSEGGYIVVGEIDTRSANLTDVLVVKLDAQGNLDPAWPENPKTFGGSLFESATAVQQTEPDRGYIVVGATRSTEPEVSERRSDALMIKLDAQGNLDPAWPEPRKILGGQRTNEVATAVQQTRDDGYIVAGSFQNSATVIKFDSRGDLDPAWPENPKIIAGQASGYAEAVQQTKDDGYILAGRNGKVVLIKLDAQGNLDPAWPENPKNVETQGIGSGSSVLQTADDGYLAVGDAVLINGVPNVGDSRIGDIVLIKLDSQGHLDPSWPENPKTFGARDNDERANSMQHTQDGGYILAGARAKVNPDGSNAIGGAYFIKLSPERTNPNLFIRGDTTRDCEVNLTDAVNTLGYLFHRTVVGDVEIFPVTNI